MRRSGGGRSWPPRPRLAGALLVAMAASRAAAEPPPVATFSIAAADPQAGEVGVAVASRFFAVGTVVPWVRAGAGAIATQSYANVSFGPRGLDRLAAGGNAAATLEALLAADPEADRRQVGVVGADGSSATWTGKGCAAWAGGRRGPGYAVQGNILAGPAVVEAMEKAFLAARGDLATRLYAALAAGDAAGGDSRGRQSAALVVARPEGGYGGFNDRYIDIRVDDHAAPLIELGRLLAIARVNGRWNRAWTAFTRKEPQAALGPMEEAAAAAAADQLGILPEVLYDLAVIRGAAGKKTEGLDALGRALAANPRLVEQARGDADLEPLRSLEGFATVVPPAKP